MGRTVTGGLDVEAIATRQEFAAALTAVRERAGLTVREVARATGMSASTVGGYFSGRHLPPLRPDGGVRAVLRACGVVDPAELETWQRTLARVRRAPGPRPGGLPPPWIGLRAYGPADAGRFHGRDDEIAALLGMLHHSGPVAVVGDAGSGKSSLLGAGLVPRLRGAPHGRPVAVLRPGDRPLHTLAGALAELADQAGAHGPRRPRPLPAAGPDELVEDLRRAPAQAGDLALRPGAVVVVDQLEELFVHCRDEDERQAFVAALAALSRRGRGPAPAAAVVVALRTRFVCLAASYPDLSRALRAGPPGPVTLRAMAPEGLRSVVLGPARAAGVTVDDGVVERVVADARCAPGPVLPRLSHGLVRAWQDGQRARIDVDDPGTASVAGSVADAADAAYDALPDDARAVARDLLVRLHIGTPGGFLPALAPGRQEPGTDAGSWDAAVRQLTEAGLLARDGDGVRPTSGCLPELWPRLEEWLSDVAEPEPAGSPTGSPATPGTDPDTDPDTDGTRPGTGREPAGWWAWRWAAVAVVLALAVLAWVGHELWS